MSANFGAITVALLLFACTSVLAGMPSPLPEHPETIFRVADAPAMRLQTLSFFLLAFLLCALIVKLTWNFIARDFPKLPRLTFGRSLAIVFLWGLLFVVVLTMISGARELMTPGAWRKQGFTYKLAADVSPAMDEPDDESRRRQHLERLRTALWQYAATHNGMFPLTERKSVIASDLWALPDGGGKYVYMSNRQAGLQALLLAYEPAVRDDRRLVLMTNGDIAVMSTVELLAALTEPTP